MPGYEFTIWWGVLAPARTSRELVNRLYTETKRSVQTNDVREKLNVQGVDTVGSSPEEFSALIVREVEKWTKVAREAGIQLDY